MTRHLVTDQEQRYSRDIVLTTVLSPRELPRELSLRRLPLRELDNLVVFLWVAKAAKMYLCYVRVPKKI